MAFKSLSVALGTSNTDVVECPSGSQGAAVLSINNITAGALTYALKIYRQATGQTVTVASGVSVPANTSAKYVAPISLEAGDKIIMTSSSASNLLVTGTFTYSASTPAAVGFTPRGPWDSGATYATNDIVSKNFNSYVAIQASTNQDPETQTAYWMLSAGRGASGAGDLTAANNLSDLANAATARTNLGVGTGNSPQFAGIELGHASDTTLTRSAAGKLDVEGHTVLTDDEEDQGPVTGGAHVTPKDLGNTTGGGTKTIDVSDRSTQLISNTAAFTLDVGTSHLGSTVLIITNGSGAGAITLTNFASSNGVTKGDAFDQTLGSVFRCTIEYWGTGMKWIFVEKMK